MEGRTGGVEQDSTSTKELETVIQGGTRGGVQQSNQQDSGEEPLRLTARSSESVTLPSSTSAPPSSESEALNLASGVMVDISFSVRSCAV